MSCEHCTHCQNAKAASQNAANAYEVGALLNHPTYGRVAYWRAATEFAGDLHWVDLPGDGNSTDMVAVSGADLTTS